MDEITNEKIVKEKDKKISFGLYDLDESSAPWLILSGNNNNNDDANLNATLSTQNMEKDEKCCNFDYFPMQKKKNLRDQAQQHGKSDDKLNIEKQADGDSIKQEENVDANDKGNDLKTKDSDAGTDDDNNNDNSFENLSYISGDEQLGVIDDIILLPNNLYSEDEMSNSDDCIYAYRGVDFEPIRSSPEDENDFLEMDFEPDPSSEIEQDNRSLRQLDGSENGVARDSNLPNRIHADLASFDVEIKPNITCNRSDIPPPSKSDKVVESGENTANGVEASAFKSLGADTHTESCDCSTSLNSDSHSSADDPLEKNDIIANTDANLRHESCSSNAPMASQSSQQSSTAIASASFTTKKYTGTIPKTNRNYLNLRSGRPKVLNASFGSTKTHRVNYPSYMCKRWKNANSVPDTLTYQTNDESQNAKDTMQTFQDSAKTKSNTKRSMSFPFEGFVHSEEESNNETQVVPTSSQVTAKLHSSQSQNQLFKQDEHVANGITFNGNCHGSVHNNASVTIFTGNCNIDVISAALAELNIRVNLRKLTANLAHINDIELMQMGITEYLIHMSKVNCDFKAIKNAIISSHDEVDLEIDFLPAELDNLEVIQIPVKEILLRLRQNSNLFDILSIRNKRFQRSNVLGQVVNAVRKFRNKHLDSLKDVYITVPQYYRSGYLSIARK